jgi:hypothetical protein
LQQNPCLFDHFVRELLKLPRHVKTERLTDASSARSSVVAESNANPKSFVWAADPRRVLAAIKGGKQALESVH